MSKGAVSEKYPLDIKDVSPEETADVLKYFKDGKFTVNFSNIFRFFLLTMSIGTLFLL